MEGRQTFHILLADVSTGAVRDLTPGDFGCSQLSAGGPSQYDFSADSTEVVFDSDHANILIRQPTAICGLFPCPETSNRATSPLLILLSTAIQSILRTGNILRIACRRCRLRSGPLPAGGLRSLYGRIARTYRVFSGIGSRISIGLRTRRPSISAFSGRRESRVRVEQLRIHPAVLRDGTIDSFRILVTGHSIIYSRSSVAEPIEIFKTGFNRGTASSPQQSRTSTKMW